MAFDLKAILRLEDRFSDPMRRIEKATARTQKAMNSLGSSTSTANRHHINLGSSVGKLTKGFGGLTGALAGTAAAYLSIGAAQKLFSETVGAAAQKQQSEVVIGAMFNDKQLSKQYISMIDKLSVASPVLNSQDVYGSSKGYISTTKNVKQLEKMWGLTERLVALDPAQGVEGATLALKELFSNDSTSIIERFEMPRKVMNEIKKLPLDKQLSALDNYFNKIGATTKLIDDMGGTAIGMWSRVREQFSLLLSDMGQPSLQVVSKFLTDVLSKLENGDLNRFRDVGARWIKNILTGLTNGIMNVYNWFNALTTSQQWKDATTLSAKVNIIIDDLLSRFNNWYEASGKKHLETMTESLTHE